MKTPQQTYPELNDVLHTEVYLKREDLHKYKSHKGRSLPLMIKKYTKEGIKKFVISSSGNAAIAAGLAVENHNRNNPGSGISLTVFIGKHISEQKRALLKKEVSDPAITIEQVDRPKQHAFQIDAKGEATFLRQSTDDLALEGYLELADDLTKIPNLKAVFIPTSSGTTAQGIAQYFKEKNISTQIHIVQTVACHPIAEEFDEVPTDVSTSIAGAIVDNIAHRKAQVVEAIKTSNGFGWIITNDEIKEAQKLVKDTTHIEISATSALSIAGLIKAQKKNWKWDGPVACIITGA